MSMYELLKSGDGNGEGQIPAIMVGIVTNNDDPDHMGRVKVKFSWRNGSDESDWARVAAFMAGKDRGGYFIPEVGDEVLVAFGNGDIHNPFIIGSLWNKDNMPPEANSNGKNDMREIVSRSGHKLILNDTEGQEKLEIRDKSGECSIVFDSKEKSVSIKSGMALKIEAQSIELKADKSIQINVPSGNLDITGTLVKIN